VGHAVRALYMYSAMADVAALTGREEYIKALDALWQDVVARKLYLTGGLGARHQGEAFGDPYELPNHTAYAETCAAIASIFWNHRLFLLHGDSRYLDVLERTLYNGFLSGIALSGDHFFYVNPLAWDGKFAFNRNATAREPWFECSCCPSNVVRLLPSLPGYQYAQQDDNLYVNLFASGTVACTVGGVSLQLAQSTAYPWHGGVQLQINPAAPVEFALHIRIPGWSLGSPVPSDLYAYLDASIAKPALTLNGESQPLELHKGFAVIRRTWQSGDTVILDLPMPVRRVVCNPAVTENQGRVALERGPLLYCFEAADNSSLDTALLSDNSLCEAVERPDLLGGITVLKVSGQEQELLAIPYYSWGHRAMGEMAVWLPRLAEK
jgi:uncharacterized protein